MNELVFEANLAALAPAQGPAPDLTTADPGSIRIDTTPTGPSASLLTPDGRWIRLHSGRDPVAEAERKVANLMSGGDPPRIVCIGLGLGYILEAIERRASTTRVLAFEPLPAVARAMLSRRTWQEWLASGRLTLLVGPVYAGVAEAARSLGADVDPPILVDPVLEREFPAQVAEARALVDQALFGARANADARRTFAPRYLLNTLRNVPVIAASADVSALDNAFAGVPAIVIAAGPSLDRNIEELRRVRGRVLFIAVDTALRSLLEAGIAPELVVSLDPSEVNGRHLQHLPNPAETWLIAEGSLEPGAFAQFAGRTFIFSVSDHHPWSWLRSIGLGRGRLRAWGSVITSAFDLALRAGCDPIVFAGADLAYSERRPYCRGTIYEQDWATRAAGGESLDEIWQSVIAARPPVMADDVAGHPVGSTSPLLAFRDWLVEQTANCGDRRIINATGGGVLVGGRIEQRSLSEALSAVQGRRSPAVAAVRAAWSSRRGTVEPDALALQRALAGLANTSGQGEPMVSWLKFGAPDLTPQAVRDALLGAANPSAPTGTAPLTQISPVPPLRYPPERVMAIRAAITGDRATHGARATDDRDGANPEPPAAVLARASSLLAAILRTSSLVDPDHPSIVEGESGHMPASRAFVWSAAATRLVLEYETALAEMLACRYDADDAALRAALDRVQVTLDRDGHGEAAGTAPHLALLADWLSVVAGWDDPRDGVLVRDGRDVPLRVAAALTRAHAEALRSGLDAPPAERVIEALTGALVRAPASAELVPVPPMRLPALSIALPSGSAPEAGPISLSIRAHDAPTATDVEPGPAWLRAARVEHPCGWVRPLRLTGPDLLPCMIGNVLDDSHALFAIVTGTNSIRIDAAGRWEPDAAWPRAISGQVPWGRAGAIAWHNAETSYVMWRERPDGDVRTETIPFLAALAFPQSDGAIWWTGFAGLWSWRPGGAWQRLVDRPALMGLQRGPDVVHLEPYGGDSTFVERPELTTVFRWHPGADAVEAVPLGPEGPCWSTSSADDWTAAAYPHSDVVLLRHRGGDERVLTCSYPFNVAWAGSSLVVSTGRGELLLFRDLIATLEVERQAASD